MTATISIIFDKQPTDRYYAETIDAVQHAIDHLGADVRADVVRTREITEAFVAELSGGVLIGPGTPYDCPEPAEDVIRSARERGVPLVGT